MSEPVGEFPKKCHLCGEMIGCRIDLDWHGLGNCAPVCERCTGSGIDPHPDDKPAIARLRDAVAQAEQNAARSTLEAAAKECDRHADFCKREWENGGDFEHLKVRHDEALYNAQRIRQLQTASILQQSEQRDAAIRDEVLREVLAFARSRGWDGAVAIIGRDFATWQSARVKPVAQEPEEK